MVAAVHFPPVPCRLSGAFQWKKRESRRSCCKLDLRLFNTTKTPGVKRDGTDVFRHHAHSDAHAQRFNRGEEK